MTFRFLDQLPPEPLREWEKTTIEGLRVLLDVTRPRKLDAGNAYAAIKKGRPFKGRHLEIFLPHEEDVTASITLAEDDHEYEIDTYYGQFRWDGNQYREVERFLKAAIEGMLEYEILFEDASPKRCRAWLLSADAQEKTLLGEIDGGGTAREQEWARAEIRNPSPFL